MSFKSKDIFNIIDDSYVGSFINIFRVEHLLYPEAMPSD